MSVYFDPVYESANVVHKFGYHPDLALNTEEDIWDFTEAAYTFSATADITQISSSDDGDGQDIEIQGLDASWNLVKQTITLTGQTPATLTTALIRVFRMKNIGTTTLAGTVYLFITGADVVDGVPDTDSEVRAVINIGNNQTLMAIYTIPNGYVGYLTSWFAVAPFKTTNVCNVRMYRRSFGGVFQIKEISATSTLGAIGFNRKYEIPEKISAKTDIKITGNSSSNNSTLSAGFDIVLRKK